MLKKEQDFSSWLFLHLPKTENVYGIYIKTDHILHHIRQQSCYTGDVPWPKVYFFFGSGS